MHKKTGFHAFFLSFVYLLVLCIAYQNTKSKLEEKKPTLEDAQGLCDKLTNESKDEPLVVASIKDKLDKVESPYEDLKAKTDELEGRLQAAQIRSQEFDVSFSDFKDKLQNMEELAAKLQPVSAVYDTLKEQKSNDEVTSRCDSVQLNNDNYSISFLTMSSPNEDVTRTKELHEQLR